MSTAKQITVSKRKLISSFIGIALICIIATGSFVYVAAQGGSTPFTISSGPYPGAPSYTIFTEGGTYYAKDANGAIAFSSTNGGSVLQNAIDAINSVGTIIITNNITSSVPIQIPNTRTITIDAQGNALIFTNTDAFDIEYLARHITLKNMVITNTGSGSGTGIKGSSISDSTFQNIYFYGNWASYVQIIDVTYGSSTLTFDHVETKTIGMGGATYNASRTAFTLSGTGGGYPYNTILNSVKMFNSGIDFLLFTDRAILTDCVAYSDSQNGIGFVFTGNYGNVMINTQIENLVTGIILNGTTTGTQIIGVQPATVTTPIQNNVDWAAVYNLFNAPTTFYNGVKMAGGYVGLSIITPDTSSWNFTQLGYTWYNSTLGIQYWDGTKIVTVNQRNYGVTFGNTIAEPQNYGMYGNTFVTLFTATTTGPLKSISGYSTYSSFTSQFGLYDYSSKQLLAVTQNVTMGGSIWATAIFPNMPNVQSGNQYFLALCNFAAGAQTISGEYHGSGTYLSWAFAGNLPATANASTTFSNLRLSIYANYY